MSDSRSYTERPRRRRPDIAITQEHIDRVRMGILVTGLALGLAYDHVPALRPLLDALVPQEATSRWRGTFDPEVAHVP